MPYGFKIQYTDPPTGAVTDITDKAARFTITASRDNYCREMVIEISDPAFYAALPLTRIPAAPAVEILTRVADVWKSQGKFFIERPAMDHELDSSVARGVWGRSETAALGEPFASKRSISVESDTTFFALATDLITGAGLTWDLADSDIADFPVYAYTYARENAYPITILSELAEYAGAYITTNRAGAVRIVQIDYAPTGADLTIAEDQIERISENPVWPSFGNRVRITPAGDLSGFRVAVTVPEPCMPADSQSFRRVYARLTDADGEPVQNTPVDWSSDAQSASLSSVRNNTATRLMPPEEVRASNYFEITVQFPPSTVRGVWAYADKTRANNLAAAGYEVSGNTIQLSESLQYCDQLVIVEYFSKGVAVNKLEAGSQSEDVKVSASVEGATDAGELYIGNACKCPPRIDLEAAPSRIKINESAILIIYAEESGPITDGRMVFLSHTNETALGSLTWGRARLGKVKINHERSAAKNEVAGITQADVARYIASVDGVWQADENGIPTGLNLYGGSFSGKTVDLSVTRDSGTALVISYTAIGAAMARFDSNGNAGTAEFKAWMNSNREAPVMDTDTAYIEDPTDPYGDNSDTDYGGVGGTGGGLSGSGYTIPESGYCHDSGGNTVVCGSGEECCYGPEGNIGCFPSDQCESGGLPVCLPKNLSLNPDLEPAERFSDEIARGCSCEELCRNEVELFGTTQDYDEASYRTIGQIVEEDYGYESGSPDYIEKAAELEQSALDQCIAQCDECGDVEPMVANDGGVMTPPGSKTISFAGGIGPFTWMLSGVSGSLEVDQTTGRENVLNVNDPDACGSAVITVKDETCGGTCEIGVRMTSGQWMLVGSEWRTWSWYNSKFCTCDWEIINGYQKWEDRTPHPVISAVDDGTFQWGGSSGSPQRPPGGVPEICPSSGVCYLGGYSYFEWQCPE
jgi:hypothetical protein